MKPSSHPNWRLRGRLAGIALLIAGALSANDIAIARTGEIPLQDQHSSFDFTAPQAAARVYLSQFFQSVLGDDGVAGQDSAVRIALATPDGKHSLVWVTPFAAGDGHYFGTIHATDADQRFIRFEATQVVDWSFTGANGRMYGNYATRLVLHTLQPAEAEQLALILSETATPAEWHQ